ncbi:HEAT repeat domain-containing protein [Photobacterium sanguinicancri]|uniref:Tetratricopeptide repeat protein n=1 Tax=Photobacterium sanguinicancri TaxID=875932 RepID=A0ABX4FWZ1_9GAMM|nr:HEAT repeat domain-containing protein [Photobacterium sanguinicancri]OZS43422.1 hypothetical protein ASV53_13375 [Photobacterium sanguinicancri]
MMKKLLTVLTTLALMTTPVYAANTFTINTDSGASNQAEHNVLVQPDTTTFTDDEHTQSSSAQNSVDNISPEQVQQWVYTAQDKRQSAQVRANALRQLAPYPSQNSLVAVVRGLQDDSEAVREAAVIAAEPYQFTNRWRMLEPLLTDPNQQVRVTATTNLIRDFGNMSPKQQHTIESAYQELVVFLSAQANVKGHIQEDIQESTSENVQLNLKSALLLADVYRWHQEWDQAQSLYETLIKANPKNAQVWLSVADNLRAQGKDEQALVALDKAIVLQPNESNLYYSQALTLVRLEQKAKAANAIEIAANMAQTNSYFWYLNGVLQEPLDIDKSVKSFEQAYLISGAPEQLYAVCDIYVRTANDKTEQCLDELGKIAPDYVIAQLKAKIGDVK